MQTFYKFFLVIFIIFTGFNLYSINWKLGFLHIENAKFLISLSAGIIGVFLVLVLNTWSKIGKKNSK